MKAMPMIDHGLVYILHKANTKIEFTFKETFYMNIIVTRTNRPF
jgi:hypothetical protein